MTGVIILNYFSHDETIRLYNSLQGYDGLSIIIIDNSNDSDEFSALEKAISESELIITGKNLGYAGGNNIGIRYFLNEPNIEAIALINPDVVIHENIFPVLLEKLASDKKVAATGPRLCIRGREDTIYSDGGVFYSGSYLKPGHLNSGKQLQDVSVGFTDNSSVDEDSPAVNLTGHLPKNSFEPVTGQPDYINGSFLVMKVDALRDVGLLDESFFLYFEEADWCLRARNAGWSFRVATEITAFQTISAKEKTYNYHFFYSWMRFLHRYNPSGVKPLFLDQLRKISWIIRSGDGNIVHRLSLARYRLKGIVNGYFNR